MLTNGAEWSFYLPGGQGSYEDRRVYRLQLEERPPEESEQVLTRYLQRDRVCSRLAYEDAQRDYHNAASLREAVAAIPQAWRDLAAEPDGDLVSIITAKAEDISGFTPPEEEVASFLAQLNGPPEKPRTLPPLGARNGSSTSSALMRGERLADGRPAITATLFGKSYSFQTAKDAYVQILRLITSADESRIPQLAKVARVTDRTHIARSSREIHPDRPDLSRVAEFVPGWFVNVNLSNKQKARILEAARATYELTAADF